MRFLWVVIFIFSVISVSGQKSSAVLKLEEQRKKALAEIELTNQLLKETNQSTKNSLSRLTLISKQILSRKKVISLLNQEINSMDNQINAMNREITALEKELVLKKENYTKSVQGLYKRKNSQDKLLYILSADNFSQSFRRMRYLQEFADWQRRQAVDITNKQKLLTARRARVQSARKEKQGLLDAREVENKKLLSEEATQKKEIEQLNKKKSTLQAELKKKKKQADDLNKQIEKQIAAEIAKAAAEQKRQQAGKSGEKRVADTKGGYAMTKEEKQLSDDFASNKGRLPYPLTGQYMIVSQFGEQQHQELKYVRVNNSGIDIQTSPGNEARAVFKGEVTRVFVVPGYNNSVIVRHGNYLTVYSNLIQVYVKAGDKVNTRQALGKIYTDTENGNTTTLHFQLWKEKDKLNPTPWLDN